MGKQIHSSLLLKLGFSVLIVLMAVTAIHAQQIAVTGTVTDAETGETLVGVSIFLVGSSTGATTDVDGFFELSLPSPDETLRFSYIGYVTQEIQVDGRTEINIQLTPSIFIGDELVVVGYGTQRAATLTGSIAHIGPRELARSPASNVGVSLQGLMPGLVSMQRSGDPGGDITTVLVRGQSTTGSNAPLVLVDGVPESDWQRINSNDIESVSILKDASAAIYGVQAANGVILITTKRGSFGSPELTFTHNQSFIQPTRLPKMASSALQAESANEIVVKDGGDPIYTDEEIQKFRDGSDPINYPNTNWRKELYKEFGSQSTSNMNIRGGSENVRYSLSGSYFYQGDLLRDGTHKFENFTIRSNIDAQVSENLGLSLDVNARRGDRNTPTERSTGVGQLPSLPVFWPGGYPSNLGGDRGGHPMINNTGGSGYDAVTSRGFSGKLSFDLVLPWVEGLAADGYFFYSDDQSQRKIWNTPWTFYSWENDEPVPHPGGASSLANLDQRFSNSNTNQINLRLQFQRQINEDHFLNTFIAAEQSKGMSENFRAFRRDFMAEAIDELFAGSDANQLATGNSSESARQNLFGRVSYNFQEKYLFDFNFRYDGSYRFHPDNRWGFFPGFSAAWRVSQERFLSDIRAIDELKLRASYGEMGNDAISAFQFLQEYNLRTTGTFFGSPKGAQPAVWGGVSPNRDITWEVATITNLGLDVELFDNLLGLNIDVFKQRRSNILTTRALEVPDYTGLVLPSENIGIVDNKGIEFKVSHLNTLSVGSGFQYSLTANMGFARSNVVDVSEAANVPEHQKMEGRPLGQGLYYIAIGIYRTQEEIDNSPHLPGTVVGDLQYFDFDGDGVITANDRVRMGKTIHPEMTFGLNLSAAYGGFTLFSHFAGVAGTDWWIHPQRRVSSNSPKELLENRYTPGSMDSKYPWIPDWHPDQVVSGMISDFWVQDASFIRLKTLELSYTLPGTVTSEFGINSLRLYLSGSNLFTWTKLKEHDPEGANPGGQFGFSGFYPQTRVFNLGVQLTF